MKTRNVLIALTAVSLFSAPALGTVDLIPGSCIKGALGVFWCKPDPGPIPFNHVNIHVGKPDQDLKLASATFMCKDTFEFAQGVLWGHEKDVNEPPLVNHEIWEAVFVEKCFMSVDVNVTVHGDRPPDWQPEIKAAFFWDYQSVGGDVCTDPLAPNEPADLCNMSIATVDGYAACPMGWPTGWGGHGQRDAWYSFVASDTQHRIRTDVHSNATDSHFAVYSGDCGSLTRIGCSEDECYWGYAYKDGTQCVNWPHSAWLGDICVRDLTPGQEYHIQLGTYAVDSDYDPTYGPSYNYCNYYPSMMFTVDVSTKFVDDKSGQICGDGVVNSPCEECETDADCPPSHACNYQELDCKCTSLIPMLPKWGLVGLGLLLLAGGAMVFRRRAGVGLESK